MRLDSRFLIEKAASADVTRQHIAHPHLDVEGKRMVATDGHMMALVPVEVEEGDVAGFVPAGACREARGAEHVKMQELLAVAATVRYVRPAGETFPPVDAVVPNYRPGEEGCLTVTITARYLFELAQALGQKKGCVTLTMPIPEKGKDMLDPIVVTTADADVLGVLMPARR